TSSMSLPTIRRGLLFPAGRLGQESALLHQTSGEFMQWLPAYAALLTSLLAEACAGGQQPAPSRGFSAADARPRRTTWIHPGEPAPACRAGVSPTGATRQRAVSRTGRPRTPGSAANRAPAWGCSLRSVSTAEVVMNSRSRSGPPNATEVTLRTGSSTTVSRAPSEV